MFQVLRLYEYQEPRYGLCSVCVKVRVLCDPMVRLRNLCTMFGFLHFHRTQPIYSFRQLRKGRRYEPP